MAPVPEVVAPPVAVTVQVPLTGKSSRSTLPVASLHVGSVMVPTVGSRGVGGCTAITADKDAEDTQPSSFSTVKV